MPPGSTPNAAPCFASSMATTTRSAPSSCRNGRAGQIGRRKPTRLGDFCGCCMPASLPLIPSGFPTGPLPPLGSRRGPLPASPPRLLPPLSPSHLPPRLGRPRAAAGPLRRRAPLLVQWRPLRPGLRVLNGRPLSFMERGARGTEGCRNRAAFRTVLLLAQPAVASSFRGGGRASAGERWLGLLAERI